MNLKKKVERIKEQNVHLVGAQDWDIKEFIDTVIDYSKVKHQWIERQQYREPLVQFFNHFKRQIADYLIARKDGLKWGHFVYETLFGKPWPELPAYQEREIETEIITLPKAVESEMNLINAVLGFRIKHRQEIAKYISENKPFYFPSFVKKFKDKIVADVREVLEFNSHVIWLEGTLRKKELIWHALTDLMKKIFTEYSIYQDAPADWSLNAEMESVYKKIITEIEARITKLAKKKAA